MKLNPIASIRGSLQDDEFIYVLKWQHSIMAQYTFLLLSQYVKEFYNFFHISH
jgi:hypothetical protein